MSTSYSSAVRGLTVHREGNTGTLYGVWEGEWGGVGCVGGVEVEVGGGVIRRDTAFVWGLRQVFLAARCTFCSEMTELH